jgi:hypothetical protein
MSVNKRIVANGENWAEDEEQVVADAYHEKVTVAVIMERFPTTRSKKSIRMKLGNHRFQDTGKGLHAGNNWVKAHWTARRTKVDLDAMLKEEERLEKEKEAIMGKYHEVNDKQRKLKEARLLAAEKELTKKEEKDLRDALKVYEELMSVKNVTGHVNLYDVEPENSAYGDRKKFEIETRTYLNFGYLGVEVSMWVNVYSTHSKVHNIVYDVFDFEEFMDDGYGVVRR